MGSIANTGQDLDPSAFPSLGIPAIDSSFDYRLQQCDRSRGGNHPGGNGVLQLQGLRQQPHSGGAWPCRLAGATNRTSLNSILQDSWKATRNLTLTYGLRYTSLQTPYEVNGQEVAPTFGLHRVVRRSRHGHGAGHHQSAGNFVCRRRPCEQCSGHVGERQGGLCSTVCHCLLSVACARISREHFSGKG